MKVGKITRTIKSDYLRTKQDMKDGWRTGRNVGRSRKLSKINGFVLRIKSVHLALSKSGNVIPAATAAAFTALPLPAMQPVGFVVGCGLKRIHFKKIAKSVIGFLKKIKF